jgi:hypothetical protein
MGAIVEGHLKKKDSGPRLIKTAHSGMAPIAGYGRGIVIKMGTANFDHSEKKWKVPIALLMKLAKDQSQRDSNQTICAAIPIV